MKVIVAGSRSISNKHLVAEAIWESGFDITEVVSGAARGVDTLGEMWAIEHTIPVKRFPADWAKLGLKAGFVRNAEMAKYADALIAVTTGSKGTGHMIDLARKQGLKIYVKEVRPTPLGRKPLGKRHQNSEVVP